MLSLNYDHETECKGNKDCTCSEIIDNKPILNCTCGSWGHYCGEEEHVCPTNCLTYNTKKETING